MADNRVEELLGEILKWQRLQAIHVFETRESELLTDKKKRKAYELTDGTKTARQIAKEVGATKDTISHWWKEWYRKGILVKEGKKYCKIVSLN